MDAGRVSESITAHDSLVGLHGHVHQRRDHAGDRIYLAGVDVRVDADILVAFQDHGNLFESGVARALTDAVDRHLNLPGTVQHAFQRVGSSHA